MLLQESTHDPSSGRNGASGRCGWIGLAPKAPRVCRPIEFR